MYVWTGWPWHWLSLHRYLENVFVASEWTSSTDISWQTYYFSAQRKTAHCWWVCSSDGVDWLSFCPMSKILKVFENKSIFQHAYVSGHAFGAHGLSCTDACSTTVYLLFIYFRKASIRRIKAKIIQLCGNTGTHSILRGTSKHTARHCTIRVHGWDENIL